MADTDMREAVVPALQCDLKSNITPLWFLDGSEKGYEPYRGTFEFLICGEQAFGEVYRAIASAKKSVSIICWGFQPSMYFVRKSAAPMNEILEKDFKWDQWRALPIGELLRQKAKAGVEVRVLCWALEIGKLSALPGAAMGEWNTPGRNWGGVGSTRNASSSARQYEYDKAWYDDHDCERRWDLSVAWEQDIKNFYLEFRSRGFKQSTRAKLANQSYEDKNISLDMRTFLASTPSHHQKMVLVDAELPGDHVGFVMGHNMIDDYWDTPVHSHVRHECHSGRNGIHPRQDLSCRITGPLCGVLYRNFRQAWMREAESSDRKSQMPEIDFSNYPLKENIPAIYAQILRTQMEYGVKDIMKMYLRVVKNATQCIYIENQYFRWPPLAEAIKAAIKQQCNDGRDPKQHDSLYLFVITNSGDEGIGAGTQKTYEMLESLERSDTMPGVGAGNTDEQIKQLEKEIEKTDKALETYENYSVTQPGWRNDPRMADARKAEQELLDKKGKQDAQLKALKGKRDQFKKASAGEDVLLPETRPGLKVHVCTLVSPDTPAMPRNIQPDIDSKVEAAEKELEAHEKKRKEQSERDVRNLGHQPGLGQNKDLQDRWKQLDTRYEQLKANLSSLRAIRDRQMAWTADGRWAEVYVHSKLMIINDTLMTLGSANINSRSMEVDSELNILHHIPQISQKARQDLWKIHTNGRGAQDDVAEAFEAWGRIIKENKDRERDKLTPTAPLRGFLRLDPKIRNLD